MIKTEAVVVTPDFADVYGEHLDRVWRFVRSRVPDHHEAHDVTSDVFVRAWRGWDRFDPPRGPVEPWLYTIAHRAVTDWWRRRRPTADYADQADMAMDASSGPEPEALRRELLAQLGAALDGLSQRERDGLALRFAARLSSEHVGRVLGTTTGAAKMMLHRALQRLAAQDLATLDRSEPADLENMIDELLLRGSASVGDAELHELLLRVETLHRPEVPPGLGRDVAHCVRCEAEGITSSTAAGDVTPGGRLRTGGLSVMLLAFSGVCLSCVVPALAALVAAVTGLLAAYLLHLAGLAVAPLVMWIAWRGARRHGRSRGFQLTRAGLIVLGLHTAVHVGADLFGLERVLFTETDLVGTGLLVWGAALNLHDLSGWRRTQRSALLTQMAAG